MQQSPQYHGTSRLENSGNDRGRAHPDSAAIPTTPTPTPANRKWRVRGLHPDP